MLARLIDARPNLDPQGWLADLPPMDLFGTLLIRMPLPWVWPVAISVLMLMLTCGVRLQQTQLLRWRALFWGSLGIAAVVAIGAAAAMCSAM